MELANSPDYLVGHAIQFCRPWHHVVVDVAWLIAWDIGEKRINRIQRDLHGQIPSAGADSVVTPNLPEGSDPGDFRIVL